MESRSAETPIGTTSASELGEQQRTRGTGEPPRARSRELAGTARKKAVQAASEQKGRATAELGAIASALRDAGSRLENESPMAGRFITSAAAKLDEVSNRIEGSDVESLVRSARRYARNNPAMFIGGAIALGFVASRFFKASADDMVDEPGDFYSSSRGTVGHETTGNAGRMGSGVSRSTGAGLGVDPRSPIGSDFTTRGGTGHGSV